MMQLRTGRVKQSFAINTNNMQYVVYAGCVAVSSSNDIGFAIGIAERYESKGYDCLQIVDKERKKVIWEGRG